MDIAWDGITQPEPLHEDAVQIRHALAATKIRLQLAAGLRPRTPYGPPMHSRHPMTITRMLLALCLARIALPGQTSAQPATSGNPILAGWYAYPEAHVFNGEYWIYPTYSAPYDEQTFMDAFSSKDLVTWTKHERVLEVANVKWATRALWAPSIVEKDVLHAGL